MKWGGNIGKLLRKTGSMRVKLNWILRLAKGVHYNDQFPARGKSCFRLSRPMK
jgi:hypothetical protein